MGGLAARMAAAVMALSAGEVGAASAPLRFPFDQEGTWTPGVHDTYCAATAWLAEPRLFHIRVDREGGVYVALRAPEVPARGSEAELLTDYAASPIQISVAGGEMTSAPLSQRATESLRQARWVGIGVGGRQIFSLDVHGPDYRQMMQDLAACAAGKSGWWGDGAKPVAR